MITETRKAEATVVGQKVLFIDDDVRNIFTMVASILEAEDGVKVTYSDNGRGGIQEAPENDPTSTSS